MFICNRSIVARVHVATQGMLCSSVKKFTDGLGFSRVVIQEGGLDTDEVFSEMLGRLQDLVN